MIICLFCFFCFCVVLQSLQSLFELSWDAFLISSGLSCLFIALSTMQCFGSVLFYCLSLMLVLFCAAVMDSGAVWVFCLLAAQLCSG
ncbi:hypothetical protein LOK49_LG10G02198 [Camellia lanceoleosa]|uniref:Uncharacterized protein n=1 Tax=Camellia lanceoleosa TaxID=1840588 RepID=A0ACC0G5U9_9ERIC|nr:hypothetical protein LOK49_LG10G02198 [Camellia lanceoleosa]